MMTNNENNSTINNTAKKIYFCANCGIVYEKHGNAQKYCVDCKRIMYAKKHKEWQRRNPEHWTKRQENAERKERLIQNMMQLREQGYTNCDIAKEYKTNCQWVYYYIGKEPVEYWKNALRAGAQIRVQKNRIHSKAVHARKKIMCEIKVAEQQEVFNAALISLEEARKSEAEAQKRAHEAQRKLNELKQALQAC